MPDALKVLKPFYDGAFINNTDFTPSSALTRVQSGLCEAIAFGRLAIKNPNLPEKI